MGFGNEILKKIIGDITKESTIEEILSYLDNEFKKEDIDIERISTFLLDLKWTLKEKNMEEEFEMIENIYLLNENNMMKLINSTNSNFLFMMRKFYAKSDFLEFYLIVLKKMGTIIIKNNLLELLGGEFIELGIQIKNYILYLKDKDEYFQLYKDEILEYNVFREVLQPFINNIINNNMVNKISKLLIFFDRMAQSPDKDVKVLLVDSVIEGGWLEKNDIVEKNIKNFGDNFLILYALVYDGRVFLRNSSIWNEVKRRNLKIE
ncbi:MAG: hypothetical protein LBV03_01175 [Fusobacteriales bacterium]|jgi:hypothetical protein|nr:hypothetical protein [Fusobacteriales bacterium]